MHRLADLASFLPRCTQPLAVALLLLCATTGLATAQTVVDAAAGDPPTRVARLSYVAGDLGLLPAGATDWSDARVNRPLTGGDRLSSGDDARAELELGGSTLRVAGRTDVGLLELSDALAQVELTQGTLNLTVRQLDDGQSYEIDTPDVALVVDRPGTFRVDVGDDGRGTRISVLDGQATVYGENQAQRDIFGGRSYQFDGSSLQAVAVSDIGGGDAFDAFDAWCGERDQRYAQSTSGQYVSEDVVGYQDLDRYGDWQTVDDYGAVWFPRQVDAGWAPYRTGHWAWIGPWGWTWIDDSPWGFAPYHYGRWAYVRNAWGWIPGPISVRPVYAPALVAFVVGGGWNVSIGIGSAPIGWFPLGPHDIYNPWYRASRGYYHRVNLGGIRWHDRRRIDRDIDDHYRHFRGGPPPVRALDARRDRRGYTVVPGRVFAGGKHVPQARLRVDARKLAAAPVLTHGTKLRPETGALARPRNPGARPLPVADVRRQVVARHLPSTPLPARNTAATARRPSASPHNTPSANVRALTRRADAKPTIAPRPVEIARDRPATRGIASASPRSLPARALPAAKTERSAGQPVRRAASVDHGLPVVPRIRPAQRTGELASSRYAHPAAAGRALPQRGLAQPRAETRARPASRPGVSFISRDNDAQPRAARTRTPSTLPQAPSYQRAAPRTEHTRAPAARPFRSAATPQRSQAAPRPIPRAAPPPMRSTRAMHSEPQRAAPRPAPQSRAASTHSQRSSGNGRALPKPLKRSQKDDRRR
jgi:hypothetical protein